MFKFVYFRANVTTISVNLNNVPILNGSNFKDWKKSIDIILWCMDLDLALRIKQPPSLSIESSPDERNFF